MTCGPPSSAPCRPSPRATCTGEIADAALRAVLLAVERFASGTHTPLPQDPATARTRPYLRQDARRIDWENDSTERVLRTLRAADSQPGVLDELLGGEWYLHGGHPEQRLRGRPGELLATRVARSAGPPPTAPCGSRSCAPAGCPGRPPR